MTNQKKTVLLMKSDLQIAREAVCWNQGEIAQFSHIASILHRNLKEEFYSETCCKEKIEFSLTNLLEYLNRNLRRISKNNFKFLHDYFDNRSKINPRFCIKANYQDRIIELFRDKQVKYYTDYETENNTGFFKVKEEGKYYLCNNIPKDYLNGKYCTPRLKTISDSKYSPSFIKNLMNSQSIISNDIHWQNCWVDDCDANNDAFYKSTLIIPMTLLNNELSIQYKILININKLDRTIFGFLCMDHVNTNYFNESSDIDMGYIIADLLSFFLINRLNYTESSTTFTDSVRYLNSS